MFLNSTKGTYLEQLKEPALSRDIVVFKNDTEISPIVVERKEKYSVEDLINFSKMANIIDDHTSKPLAEILQKVDEDKIITVVADALNDEPYISNQMNPFLKFSDQVVFSLNLIAKAFEAEEKFVAVYRHIYDCEIKVPKIVQNVIVKKMSGKYPVEAKSKLFNSEDTLIIGSGCLIHLYRFIKEFIPQTTVFITVGGNCIGNPSNMEVSLGTPILSVLEKCGLINNPEKIILGDPMTGRSVSNLEKEVVTADTKAVLAFSKSYKGKAYSCIRCGKCEISCPRDLNPMYIYKAISKNKYMDAKKFGVDSCIGCGACSYVCPARLNLSSVIYDYKFNRKKRRNANNGA